jgi:hypothetical protein
MKTTEENNRMIAEFMGNPYEWCSSEMAWYDKKAMLVGTELKYHTSWDWLMPVVIKLNDEHNVGCMRFDIKNAYRATCKFIEWYNENRKS